MPVPTPAPSSAIKESSLTGGAVAAGAVAAVSVVIFAVVVGLLCLCRRSRPTAILVPRDVRWEADEAMHRTEMHRVHIKSPSRRQKKARIVPTDEEE